VGETSKRTIVEDSHLLLVGQFSNKSRLACGNGIEKTSREGAVNTTINDKDGPTRERSYNSNPLTGPALLTRWICENWEPYICTLEELLLGSSVAIGNSMLAFSF